MPWVMVKGCGPYYRRSRKVNGRWRTDYFGRGLEASLASDADLAARLERQRERRAREAEAAREAPAERLGRELTECCGLVTSAVLVAAGFHRQDRGAWRKRCERHG
jgi:hypothetical protein